ncbi:MAG: hydantoinase/oxoprolinase family protein [Thermomicrobiales bacterium]
MSYRLGIDVGGTFTDFVLVDDAGQITEAKTPSTRANPAEAIERGLRELAEKIDRPLPALLADCHLLIHGTTIALNTLIQQTGAKTGLICTEGFRDTLEIRLGYRDHRYDFRYPPPPLLVPRALRLPVRERIDKNGKVITPLVEEDVRRAAATFRAEGVEAVAVCLLWSFYNPIHERRIGDIVREEMPDVYRSLSVDVAPQIREYDRVSTTVLNAYVGPRLTRYLQQTESFLRELGYTGEIRYIQSNGGIAAGGAIETRAILALNSGPAAAPAAGLFFGRQLGEDNLITIDMGGTSFDACLIDHGVPDMKGTADVHRYRLAAPMININTIGAGGGSVAWLDRGIPRVGPESAEAVPGPACYARGGTRPTVTDADVVLGYLNPVALLGGRFPIDRDRAHQAIATTLADPLGISVPQAALGVFEIVNRNMANAIAEISLARGFDPRDFVLVAAGGQGAVHAGELARELSIPTVVVPKLASTFCAFGALVTDLRHDYKQSFGVRLSELDPSRLEGIFQEMEATGLADLAAEGVSRDEATIVRGLEMRYVGQIFEVPVDVTGLTLDSDVVPEIMERLHRQHEKEYTYRHESGVGEIINATVTCVGHLPPVRAAQSGYQVADGDALLGERPMYFRQCDDYRSTPVYSGARLVAGDVIAGPAVVEEDNATVVVFPGFDLELTPHSLYLMRLREGDRTRPPSEGDAR